MIFSLLTLTNDLPTQAIVTFQQIFNFISYTFSLVLVKNKKLELAISHPVIGRNEPGT